MHARRARRFPVAVIALPVILILSDLCASLLFGISGNVASPDLRGAVARTGSTLLASPLVWFFRNPLGLGGIAARASFQPAWKR